MNTITHSDNGLSALERTLDDVKSNAAAVANPVQGESNTPTDLAKPLVVLANDESQAAAAAKVVKTNDQSLGSLLDVTA